MHVLELEVALPHITPPAVYLSISQENANQGRNA